MFGDIGEKDVCSYITRFFISNFYKQRQAEIGKKSKQSKQHPEAESLLFEIYLFSSSTL